MAKLEETHSEKAKLLESLQSELSSVQAQQYKLEQEVGGRRDSLATDERQLRVGTVRVHMFNRGARYFLLLSFWSICVGRGTRKGVCG